MKPQTRSRSPIFFQMTIEIAIAIFEKDRDRDLNFGNRADALRFRCSKEFWPNFCHKNYCQLEHSYFKSASVCIKLDLEKNLLATDPL